MIQLPEKCLRDLNDCEPLAQIQSDCGGSFICCGLNDGSTRELPQDVFRVCWKNKIIDEKSDWDHADVKDTISVLAQALSAEQHIRQIDGKETP